MARFRPFPRHTASDCRLALCVILGVAAVAAGGCGRDVLTGHPTFEPDINVDPMVVGFGSEPLGVRAVRTVTISNTGNFPLTIHSITLIENDGVEELTAVPTGDVDLTVPAGDSTEVQLTLTNRDGLQDSGQLLISSDDPDEAVVEVTLVSEIKGDVALGTCVMTTPILMEACVPDPEVIDFGTLPYDAVAEQDVLIFNEGTGNKPLRLDDVFVTNTTGNSGLFRLDFFRMVEDASAPGTFIEEEIFDFPTAPYWLSVDDGLDAPEVVIARVTFSAGLDGEPVPPENLIIETDDPLDSSHEIPFAGDIGCPPGLYDYDSQPGCEYACDLTNGGVEICDGLDNDCNGSIDDGVSPGLCLICDSSGNPAVGVDDDACGSIDCSGWFSKSGIASSAGTDECYAHEPITANRCEGWQDCKDPNTLDCGATVQATTPVLSCGICQYVDGCDGTTPGTCANYAAGTPTTLCVGCDGAGREGSIADDPACGVIACAGWYVRVGTEGAGETNSCHGREPITLDRCEGAGDCKDPDTADCDSQPASLTAVVTCGICERVIGCLGSIPGMCESYLPGTPTGLCSVCGAGGGETMPADDTGCGTIDCSGWYTKTGSAGPLSTEGCFAHENLIASRCEGIGDCMDDNSTDCDPSPLVTTPQVTCGTCRYMSDCNGTLAGSCTSYPDGTFTSGTCGTGVCERDYKCDGAGGESCTPGPSTGTDNDCDGFDDNCSGLADENYVSYSCGVGICERWSTCVAGSESCSPGSPQATDDPDDLFIDSNCDGIDGDVAIGIFVAIDGNDATGDGSQAFPYRTIQYGINTAVDGQHVYVSEGTYNEVVTFKNGVSVYGGYSRVNAWDRGWGYVVTISASSPTSGRMVGVFGFNLTSAAVIADMTIGTANASSAGMSNYGFYCSNCDGLTLRGMTIVAGSGFDGTDGNNGIGGGNGNNGSNGAPGSCDGSRGLGGAGGGSSCGRTGGNGGRGGSEGCNNGIGGGSGVSGVSGGAGGAHCDGGCCSGCTASGGGSGTSGGSGSNGINGGTGSGGLVSGGYWATNGGGNGTDGGHGNGGGGGGGGGAQCGWVVNDGGGNGAGGGGAGGCLGTLSTGGSGGGGSFGLFLVGSTGILLLGNTITASDGGAGGDGGVGGAGGLGGNRGMGATTCTGEVGRGGNGGWGGNGGNGGSGGGAAGGPSYSVYHSGTTVSLSGNILSFGNGGGGGWSAVNAGVAGATGQTN